MVHQPTAGCVQKAQALMLDASEDSMRYATLQLRMGIEYLFYELIPLYREELPDDITTTKWQPREILDALLECDPHVDQAGRVGISPPSGDGANNPAIVKEIKPPTKRILRDHYHRLGSYLHAPVSLVQPDIRKWRTDLERVTECLKQYNQNQILINIRQLINIICDCGRVIKRSRLGVEATGEMRCPNPDCRAMFDVKLEENQVIAALRKTSYVCPYCRTENFVPVHRLRDGIPISCVQCARRVVARSGFVLDLLDGQPDPESAANGSNGPPT